MKIKKSMTEKAITANQQNGRLAHGPTSARGKEVSSRNPARHWLVAKRLMFGPDEQEQFVTYRKRLRKSLAPADELEAMLVEEIAVCWWKLRQTTAWLQKMGFDHNPPSNILVDALEGQRGTLDLPAGHKRRASTPWDCKEFMLSVSSGKDRGQGAPYDKDISENKHVEIKAKVTTRVETVQRYERTIKRDLYRAMRELRELQKRR